MAIQLHKASPAKTFHYLEIGVSYGKCILIQNMFFGKGGQIWGYSFESINPTLKKNENFRETKPFDQARGLFQLESVTGANFYYQMGDVFKGDQWNRMAQNKEDLGLSRQFQLIYSDAMHNSAGVTAEFENIFRVGLLDPDNFLIIYDDCSGGVKVGAQNTLSMLPKYLQKQKSKATRYCWAVLKIGGWSGIHEPLHPHCMISSLDLKEVMDNDKTFSTQGFVLEEQVVCKTL